MPDFQVTPYGYSTVSATLVDASGMKASVGIDRLPDTVIASEMEAWATALSNISNAGLLSRQINNKAAVALSQALAYDEAWATVGVKLVLEFQREDLSLRTVEVPAPDASVFLTDGNTADPANVLVDALVVATLAMINKGLTVGDPGYHRFVRGYRQVRSRALTPAGGKPSVQEPDTGSSPPQDPASEPGP